MFGEHVSFVIEEALLRRIDLDEVLMAQTLVVAACDAAALAWWGAHTKF